MKRRRPLRYELKWLRPCRPRREVWLLYLHPGQWVGLRAQLACYSAAQKQRDPRGTASPCDDVTALGWKAVAELAATGWEAENLGLEARGPFGISLWRCESRFFSVET